MKKTYQVSMSHLSQTKAKNKKQTNKQTNKQTKSVSRRMINLRKQQLIQESMK